MIQRSSPLNYSEKKKYWISPGYRIIRNFFNQTDCQIKISPVCKASKSILIKAPVLLKLTHSSLTVQ